jgi:hypothetical protein
MNEPNGPRNTRKWYHLSHGGAGVAPVLASEKRREIFLDSLAQASRKTGIEIHGFALLPRRYHLIARGTEDSLVSGMLQWIRCFTEWVHNVEGGERPLLAARCGREQVAEADLADLLSQIHYAPVAVGMSDEREHYDWTSYLYYIGEKQCPTWLTVSALRDYVSAPVSIDVATSAGSISGIEVTDFDIGDEPTPLHGINLDSVVEETSSVTDL